MVYIINFVSQSDPQIVTNVGGTVLRTYDNIACLLEAELTQLQHDIILADHNVVSISPIQKVEGAGFKDWSDSNPKAWDIVNSSNYYDAGHTGTGIKVCVIDTGCAQHPTSCVVPSGRFKDCVGTNLYCYDDHGHGTQITNIISCGGYNTGHAEGVTMYVAKSLDSNNGGTSPDMVEGINWAISQGVHIINLSILLTDSNLSPNVFDPNTDPIVLACRAAYAAGIMVVSIAGNGTNNDFVGVGRCTYPGKDYSCICVGSIQNTGNTDKLRSSFSNWGTGLDVMAPGDWLLSAGLTDNSWTSGRGTSLAAPIVVGHLACLKQRYPTLTNDQLIVQLKNSCYYPSGQAGNTSGYGYGIVSGLPNVSPPTNVVVTQPNTLVWDARITWTRPANASHSDIKLSLNSDMSSPVDYEDQANIDYTIPMGSWGNKYFQVRCSKTYTKPDGVSNKVYNYTYVNASPLPINIVYIVPPSTSVKVYLSGSWQLKPTKVYIGGTWVTKPVKFWNGSSWVI